MIAQRATFIHLIQNLSYFLKMYSSVLKYLKSICYTIKYLINKQNCFQHESLYNFILCIFN